MDCNNAGQLSFILWMTPLLLVASTWATKSWGWTSASSVLDFLLGKSVRMEEPFQGSKVFMLSLFPLLLLLNLYGVLPFAYSPTSALGMVCPLAISVWAAITISGWTKYPMEAIAHLAPSGAPSALIPLLALIELASLLLRPITLSLRLLANIMAGHVVLGLLAGLATSLACTSGLFWVLVPMFYNMFELFVCVIQAYVFTTLSSLYLSEHPS